VERLQGYMLKAVREAKMHTSWLTQNQPYEEALGGFVEKALTGAGGAKFIPLMLPLQRRLATLGMLNSLSQVVVKLGSPGVPDVYQGADLWDLSLVDPDNRRAVDFQHRASLLDGLEPLLTLPHEERAPRLVDLTGQWRDGRIKLLATAAGLRMRQSDPELFLSGGYLPIETELSVPAGAVAFARVRGDSGAVFVAPRLCAALLDGELAPPLGGDPWKTSRILLPPELTGRAFRHEITGAVIQPATAAGQSWIFLGQIFEHVPIGILRAI
jgi:(1->4)-alpha-D-glucan 1-alpha-D-glucosylmutase